MDIIPDTLELPLYRPVTPSCTYYYQLYILPDDCLILSDIFDSYSVHSNLNLRPEELKEIEITDTLEIPLFPGKVKKLSLWTIYNEVFIYRYHYPVSEQWKDYFDKAEKRLLAITKEQ